MMLEFKCLFCNSVKILSKFETEEDLKKHTLFEHLKLIPSCSTKETPETIFINDLRDKINYLKRKTNRSQIMLNGYWKSKEKLSVQCNWNISKLDKESLDKYHNLSKKIIEFDWSISSYKQRLHILLKIADRNGILII